MQMSRLWGLLTRTEVTVPTVLKSVTTFFIVFSFQNDVLTPQIFTDELLFFFIIGLLKVVLIMSTLNLLKKYKSCFLRKNTKMAVHLFKGFLQMLN